MSEKPSQSPTPHQACSDRSRPGRSIDDERIERRDHAEEEQQATERADAEREPLGTAELAERAPEDDHDDPGEERFDEIPQEPDRVVPAFEDRD